MKIFKNAILILLVCAPLLASCRENNNPVAPVVNTTTAINDATPTLTNEYSQACSAYREFLLGQRTDDRGSLLYYEYYTYDTYESEFTFVDINNDGIPELHFRSSNYNIYTYRNGLVIMVNSFSRYAELLNNLAVYSDFWDRNPQTEATRRYVEFGEDLKPCFSLDFDYDNISEIYRVAYLNQDVPIYITKDEFIAITSPIITYCTDPKNYDTIAWINYGEWLGKHKDEYVPLPN